MPKLRKCVNYFQHVLDFQLDICKATSIEEAFDQYFTEEILDGPNAYNCDKCSHFSRATKSLSIERLPKVLCVQLNRYAYIATSQVKCA